MESLKLSSYGPGTVQVQSKSDLKRFQKILKNIKDLDQELKLNSLCHLCVLILTIRNLTKELDTDGVRLV